MQHKAELEQYGKENALALRLAKQTHDQEMLKMQSQVEDEVLDEIIVKVCTIVRACSAH